MTVLVRDDAGHPLNSHCRMVNAKGDVCGRFTLNTHTHLCTRCMLGSTLEQQRRANNEQLVTAAADAWLREGRH